MNFHLILCWNIQCHSEYYREAQLNCYIIILIFKNLNMNCNYEHWENLCDKNLNKPSIYT